MLFSSEQRSNKFSQMFCSSCGGECPSTANFCHQCGQQLTLSQVLNTAASSVDKEELFKEYFHRGYPYAVIVSLLEKRHGVRMHVRTLKRKLKELEFKRRGGDFDKNFLRELIKLEMQGPGSLAGYRYLWHALRIKHHVNVPRNLVATNCKTFEKICSNAEDNFALKNYKVLVLTPPAFNARAYF